MSKSATGAPLDKGDRVLYLCQCGKPTCSSGERATVLSKEELNQHFEADWLADDAFVAVKFDSDALPCGCPSGLFIHLESLGVQPADQGPVFRGKTELRVLLVDTVTKDHVPHMSSGAHLIINVDDNSVVKFPEEEFAKVQLVGVKEGAHHEQEGRKLQEHLLSLGLDVQMDGAR